MLAFNPTDWYWQISGKSTTLVYSSKRNIYVDPTTDTAYGNWLTYTGLSGPYSVVTEAEVWYYAQSFMPSWYYDTTTNMMSQPATGQWYKGQLNNYNASVRFNHVNGGMVAAGIPIKTDDYSRNQIQGAVTMANLDPTFHTQFYGSDGNWYAINAQQIIEMGSALGNHSNACFTVFYNVGQGILTGSVTTPSQIDAAYVGL